MIEHNYGDFFTWWNYVKSIGVKNYVKQLLPQYLLIIIPILLSLPTWIEHW